MENHQKATIYDKILEVAAIAALLWMFYPLLFYSNIDGGALIPTHFNFSGEADGWGSRSVLWIVPMMGLAIYIGLSILQKYPRIYNYPCKVTEKNAGYLYKMGVQLMRHVKTLCVLIFAYANNNIYSVAIGEATGPNLFIVYTFITGLFLLLIIYTIKMVRYKPEI